MGKNVANDGGVLREPGGDILVSHRGARPRDGSLYKQTYEMSAEAGHRRVGGGKAL